LRYNSNQGISYTGWRKALAHSQRPNQGVISVTMLPVWFQLRRLMRGEKKPNRLQRMRSRRRLTVGKGKLLLISRVIITPAESQGRKGGVDLK